MKSPSDPTKCPTDAAYEALWEKLARSMSPDDDDELQTWTQHQMDLIDAIFTALRMVRIERMRQQPVVSLNDYRKAKEEV